MIIPTFDNKYEAYVFCLLVIGGLRPPYKYGAKYIGFMLVIKGWGDHPLNLIFWSIDSSRSSGSLGMIIPTFDNRYGGYEFCCLLKRGPTSK